METDTQPVEHSPQRVQKQAQILSCFNNKNKLFWSLWPSESITFKRWPTNANQNITAEVETMYKALCFGDSSSSKTFWACKDKTKEKQDSKQEEKACLHFSHALQEKASQSSLK